MSKNQDDLVGMVDPPWQSYRGVEGRYANSKEMYKSAIVNDCFKIFYYSEKILIVVMCVLYLVIVHDF